MSCDGAVARGAGQARVRRSILVAYRLIQSCRLSMILNLDEKWTNTGVDPQSQSSSSPSIDYLSIKHKDTKHWQLALLDSCCNSFEIGLTIIWRDTQDDNTGNTATGRHATRTPVIRVWSVADFPEFRTIWMLPLHGEPANTYSLSRASEKAHHLYISIWFPVFDGSVLIAYDVNLNLRWFCLEI